MTAEEVRRYAIASRMPWLARNPPRPPGGASAEWRCRWTRSLRRQVATVGNGSARGATPPPLRRPGPYGAILPRNRQAQHPRPRLQRRQSGPVPARPGQAPGQTDPAGRRTRAPHRRPVPQSRLRTAPQPPRERRHWRPPPPRARPPLQDPHPEAGGRSPAPQTAARPRRGVVRPRSAGFFRARNRWRAWAARLG